ncbi:MAG: chloride channel protein, partial [Candidatus Hydrogenedentota bacterium]
VAIVGFFVHESLGSGLGFLQKLMSGENLISHSPLSNLLLRNHSSQHALMLFLLLVAVAKIVTTSFTIGSGGSGGLLVPSLFIGGCLGAAVGLFGQIYFPSITSSYIPFIPVGMASFFAGVANAPIASVIMVTEMTGSYVLLAPLITVAVISMILCHKFSLYDNQKLNKFESPAHTWDITAKLMRNFTLQESVKQFQQEGILTPDTSFRSILRQMSRLNRYTFPVIDSSGKYIGIVSLAGIGREQKRSLLKQKVKAQDLLLPNSPIIVYNDSLSKALETMLNFDLDCVPVVDENRNLLGTIGFHDILAGYHKRLTGKDIERKTF